MGTGGKKPQETRSPLRRFPNGCGEGAGIPHFLGEGTENRGIQSYCKQMKESRSGI